MVGSGQSEVELRFARIRSQLDNAGYLESLGHDSLRLVEHLYNDLVKTTESLQKTLTEYGHFKQIAEELECGVEPFKEENVRLYKENSQLRMAVARALEQVEDNAREPLCRVRELESENSDLKVLVNQFAERLSRAEVDSFEKSKRIVKLQEKDLSLASVTATAERGRRIQVSAKLPMEVDSIVVDACPQCIRLRNFVEYGKNSDRNPKAADYIKLADSRIEALQLQLRSCKNSDKEHMALITSLKSRIDTRDAEIDKLRDLIKIRPGRDNQVNALLLQDDKMGRNLHLELKSAEMKLDFLQRRNFELEEKLKRSILQEHDDYMQGKLSAHFGERNVLREYLEKELDKYPSHDKMNLLEKLYYLERQLSHCCKEKAALKKQIEDYRSKHIVKNQNGTVSIEEYYVNGKVQRKSPRVISNKRSESSIRSRVSKQSFIGKKTEKTGMPIGKSSSFVPKNGTRRTKVISFYQREELDSAEESEDNDEKGAADDDDQFQEKQEVEEVVEIESDDEQEHSQAGSDQGDQGQRKPMAPGRPSSRPMPSSNGLASQSKTRVSKVSKLQANSASAATLGKSQSMENFRHNQPHRQAKTSHSSETLRTQATSKTASGYQRNKALARQSSESRFEKTHAEPGIPQTVDYSSAEYLDSEEEEHAINVGAPDNDENSDDDVPNADVMHKSKIDGPPQAEAKRPRGQDLRQQKAQLHSDKNPKAASKSDKPQKADESRMTAPKKTVAGRGGLQQRQTQAPGRPSFQKQDSRRGGRDTSGYPVAARRTGMANAPAVSDGATFEDRNKQSVNDSEGRSSTKSWANARQDSEEKRALLDKIGSLQPKLDKLHAENSRHQLKTFELQGELERTKQMLQAEKQERELATVGLKRSEGSVRGRVPKQSSIGKKTEQTGMPIGKASSSAATNQTRGAKVISFYKRAERDSAEESEDEDNEEIAAEDDAQFQENEEVEEAMAIESDDMGYEQYSEAESDQGDQGQNKQMAPGKPSSRPMPSGNRLAAQNRNKVSHQASKLKASSTPGTTLKQSKSTENVRHNQLQKNVKGPQSSEALRTHTSSVKAAGPQRNKALARQSSDSRFEKNHAEPGIPQAVDLSSTAEYLDSEDEENLNNVRMPDEEYSDDNSAAVMYEGKTSKTVGLPQADVAKRPRGQDLRQTEAQSFPDRNPKVASKGDKAQRADESRMTAPQAVPGREGLYQRQKEYSRGGDRDAAGYPLARRTGMGDASTVSDRASFEDRNKQIVTNPYNANRGRILEDSHSVRSIGVNTEGRSSAMSWADARQDSQEKRALLDKIGSLQRKLDELHAESSRHQLKTFELQGELERTKHMLQVEKQERELATVELKRLREQNSESTARMLMHSAMGSDGSFRRGASPMEMEREIVNLRAALSSLDRDKDEMRVELDRKDEKLARLTNDAARFMDEMSQLKLRLKNAELQISHTGESAKEQTREVDFLKKQLEANRRDLEKTIRERDDALKDLHKVTGAHAKGQMERRNVASELEQKSKEADDLRKQVQRYIDEVRRIEELLLDKEEEMEMLIQHYRALTVENNNLEQQRTSLEREASSIRESVRDAVDQNISVKTQLASQNALVQSLEEEIQRLTQQVSQQENQMGSKVDKEKMLEADVKASKDLLYRLEVQMDKLKLDMADSESKRKQLEVENEELNSHIAALEARLNDESDRQQQLESLMANSREKDFQNERATQGISRERDELAERLTGLQQRSETLNSEVSRYRLKSIELQSELDRTRRQLDNEKRDRETALTELRRVREQLSSSSANYLLNSALGTSASSTGGGLLSSESPPHLVASSSSVSTLRQPGLGAEIQQRGSREQSPFAPTPPSDVKLDTPIASSTSRGRQEQLDTSGTSNPAGSKDDTFEPWDSPK